MDEMKWEDVPLAINYKCEASSPQRFKIIFRDDSVKYFSAKVNLTIGGFEPEPDCTRRTIYDAWIILDLHTMSYRKNRYGKIDKETPISQEHLEA